MDSKLHRSKRTEFFKQHEQRYENVLKQLGVKSLKELEKMAPASLKEKQISAILEFLPQESRENTPLEVLPSRTSTIAIDKGFHGTESDLAQTLKPEQEDLFKNAFPKARRVLARMVLPKLLERFDTHLNERPPFNIDEYAASGQFPNTVTDSAADFLGWAQNVERTDDQIRQALMMLQKEEAPIEYKRYQGHSVRIELDRHRDLLFQVTLAMYDESLREIWYKISDAETRFTSAFVGGGDALRDSLFSDDLAPLDPMPFLSDTEMISARKEHVRALRLGDKPVPPVLAQLICDVKIQYILNRPLAFAAIARTALEELLRFHNEPEVSNSDNELRKRIAAMKKDRHQKKQADDIRIFGNRALHRPEEFIELGQSTIDKEMHECMKALDALVECFLKGSKKL
jgi:hypothetical protein